MKKLVFTNWSVLVILVSLRLLFPSTMNAQVGIGVKIPDSSSILELKADNKGLLIPRLQTGNREAISNPVNSLLVYDVGHSMFYFSLSNQWFSLHPWTSEAKSIATPTPHVYTTIGNVGIGTATPSQKLDVNGNVNINGDVNVTTAGTIRGYGTIPVGGIIMWNGISTSVPNGWAICDGTNGTPDLRDRFVVGAGNTYALAAIGGDTSNAHTHPIPHTHPIDHNHVTFNSEKGGNHKHGMNTSNSWAINRSAGSTGMSNENTHLHGVNPPLIIATSGAVSTPITGAESNHENRPPYYAVYYIMRIL